MGTSNDKSPLMKHEIELKKTLLSVMDGAQIYKKERLRNVAKNELERGKW